MMHNLSQIFPLGYPNPPSYEDLQFEVQDLLRHAESSMDILHTINKISCPYYRKALASIIPYHWHQMEQNGIEPAVYHDSDGQWRITWINIDYDMRQIIKQANAQQVELELNNQPQTTLFTNHSTPNTTTMPVIINGNPQTLNHYEGAHYENCTFITTTPAPSPAKEKIVEDIVPIIEETRSEAVDAAQKVDIDAFRSLLTIPYLNRKDDCQHMLELLTQPGYSKKDHARMALALYQSGNVALKREHITTFKQWYGICCELLGWEDEKKSYTPRDLTPNQTTKQIQLYL